MEGKPNSPAQHAAQQRGVETLGRGQPPLHLGDGDLVLGGGGEEGEAARGGAEHLQGELAQSAPRLLPSRLALTLALLKLSLDWEGNVSRQEGGLSIHGLQYEDLATPPAEPKFDICSDFPARQRKI